MTCDGSVDICNSEDINAKMRACGWDVIDDEDGCYDVEGITAALMRARSSKEKPTFINVRTVIGVESKFAGDAKAHGAAFGEDEVANIKRKLGLNPDEHFAVPDEVYQFFSDAGGRGRALEESWNQLLLNYSTEHPEMYEEFRLRMLGRMTQDWTKLIPSKEEFPASPTASRKSAGLCCNPLAAKLENIMVGTADLTPSVNMAWKGKVDFQHVSHSPVPRNIHPFTNQNCFVQPELKTTCGLNGNYTGRYIHWGIREHAMASISNGLAAFNKGTILPITSSFFMFYIVSGTIKLRPV